MEKDPIRDILIFLSITFLAVLVIIIQRKNNKQIEKEMIEIVPDSLDLSLLDLNKDNFMFVCDYYDIAEPEVVYAQAQLESGRFTSKVFRDKNNFLGLYNSRAKEYYTFNHWTHCLKGYKDYVQSKWDGKCNYYTFLERLPYAEDPAYISKIKRIVNQ